MQIPHCNKPIFKTTCLIRAISFDNIRGLYGMCDIDFNYTGRPYGGVAVICRNIPCVSFSELETDSDRITGTIMKDVNGNALQVIISVYMPFYSGVASQTDLFIETIDSSIHPGQIRTYRPS